MIKDNYSYKDFFKYLKSLNWDTFEKFIEIQDFVVLIDYYPKSKHHFLILFKNQDIDNLLEINKEQHYQLFQQKQQLANDLIDNLIEMDIEELNINIKATHPFKKFCLSNQGLKIYGLSQDFIEKYQLTTQYLLNQHFVNTDDNQAPEEIFKLNQTSLINLGETVCNIENLRKYQVSEGGGLQIGINKKDSLYKQQQRVEQGGMGRELVREQFQMGYHLHPSLHLLHCHIISRDFNSEALKRPSHWLAFNDNQFYIPLAQVIHHLATQQPIHIQFTLLQQLYTSKHLVCPFCQTNFSRSLQSLKHHYSTICYPKYIHSHLHSA